MGVSTISYSYLNCMILVDLAFSYYFIFPSFAENFVTW